jgi:uncharacterized protein (TIGR00369 family)
VRKPRRSVELARPARRRDNRAIAGTRFTTLELNLSVLGAARDGEVLTAVGEPLHIGSRSQVWEVKVFREERLTGNFTCTQMLL